MKMTSSLCVSPITHPTRRIAFVVLALVGPTTTLCLCQNSPDIKAIIEGVSKTYKNRSRYEVVETMTMELDAGNAKGVNRSRVRIATQEPNKFRLESENSNEINGLPVEAFSPPMLIIGDGTDVWEESPAVNQYKKVRPSDVPTIRTWVQGAEQSVFDIPSKLETEIGKATFLREESIALDGKDMDCFVIRLVLPDHPESTTLWVEKTLFLVRRIRLEQGPGVDAQGRTGSITSDFPVVNIGGALPGSIFVFTPPPGATEVDKATP
jgi:outer membrane lipoprotein-sorting protein